MPCTLGEVKLTAGSRAAAGVPAIGQLLPINQNVALLGTKYGGDGKSNGMTYSICIFGDWPS